MLHPLKIEKLIEIAGRELNYLETHQKKLVEGVGRFYIEEKIAFFKDVGERLRVIKSGNPLFPMRNNARDVEKADAADEAVKFAVKAGQTIFYNDEDQVLHLQWIVDQMIRKLAGSDYAKVIPTGWEHGRENGA